jgi:hypothetical protein
MAHTHTHIHILCNVLSTLKTYTQFAQRIGDSFRGMPAASERAALAGGCVLCSAVGSRNFRLYSVSDLSAAPAQPSRQQSCHILPHTIPGVLSALHPPTITSQDITKICTSRSCWLSTSRKIQLPLAGPATPVFASLPSDAFMCSSLSSCPRLERNTSTVCSLTRSTSLNHSS